MNIAINLINKIYVKNIENNYNNLVIKLSTNDNILNLLLSNLNISDPINVEQYDEFKRRIITNGFSTQKKSFFFTNSLFFSLDNPLYEINSVIFSLELDKILVKINYSSNIKYLYHELANPLNTIYNASILINLEVGSNTGLINKLGIEQYTSIINNQIDNCLYLTKSFIESENDIQHLNLFQYLKSYLNEYYNSYNYLIQYDNEKLNNLINMNTMVKVPKNIVYMKIILDNIFKNAILHNKSEGLVSMDFTLFENYTQLEIVNVLDKDITMQDVNEQTKMNYNVQNANNANNANNASNASNANNANNANNASNFNTGCNNGRNPPSYSNLYKCKQSHFIGMELISKLCNKLSFKWNLVQNNDKIVFYLDIPCYNIKNSKNLITPYNIMNLNNTMMVCV